MLKHLALSQTFMTKINIRSIRKEFSDDSINLQKVANADIEIKSTRYCYKLLIFLKQPSNKRYISVGHARA